jgi:hypothetical protein
MPHSMPAEAPTGPPIFGPVTVGGMTPLRRDPDFRRYWTARGISLAGSVVTWVVGVAFGVQTAFVFFDAANFGALPAIAGRERLAAAASAIHGAGTVLDLTMPLAAGAAVAVMPPPLLLLVDLMSFLASALLVGLVRTPLNDDRPHRTPPWREAIGDGLRFLVRHPVLRVQTVVSVLT